MIIRLEKDYIHRSKWARTEVYCRNWSANFGLAILYGERPAWGIDITYWNNSCWNRLG